MQSMLIMVYLILILILITDNLHFIIIANIVLTIMRFTKLNFDSK